MKSIQYIFPRDRMEDPVDHTKWERGQIRHAIPSAHAAKLLKHADCWVEVEKDPEGEKIIEEVLLEHELEQADKREAKQPLDLPLVEEPDARVEVEASMVVEEEEDEDEVDDTTGNMPRLEALSKAQLQQFAKREFNQSLDPSMKATEMRAKITGWSNGAKRGG